MSGISTVFHISWLNFRHDRVAIVLTFALPLVFFSIFAAVFGAMDQDRLKPIPAMLAVEDEHEVSAALAELLRREPGLQWLELSPRATSPRTAARRGVQTGQAAIAVVIPTGFGQTLVEGERGSAEIELLSDRSNPIAAGVVSGLVQAAAFRLGADALAGDGIPGVLAPQGDAGPPADGGPLRLRVVDVLGGDQKRPSVAFFAAGIGVMFLLFALSGRSAILIEERESGVLGRLLAARISLTGLLLGRWLFLVVLGSAQVTVMFVWASLAFGLELWTPRHLAGFVVMTLSSAAVAAAFGLALSSACRSRSQLNGISAVVILILSVLGGNMFPRFLMPERLEAVGRLTFNAWAVDGYQKIFWYEAGVMELWPQVAVLFGFCLVFLVAAQGLARRWQVV